MIIAVDLDGTVMNTIQAWIDQFHPAINYDSITEYDFWKIKSLGVTKKQFFDELGRLDPKFVKLHDGAKDMLNRLAKNHKVYFLSSKTDDAFGWTIDVLAREGLSYISLVVSWKKEEHLFDFIVEDAAKNCEASCDKCILIDRPWNKDCKCGKRIYDLGRVCDIVDKSSMR